MQQNNLKECELKFRTKITNKLMGIEAKKPKEFWNLISKMKKWGSQIEDPSDCIQPDEWVAHFQSLLNDGLDTSSNMIEELVKFEKDPTFSELDFSILENEIEKALKKMDNNATTGLDKIPTTLLCKGKKFLMPLFNKIFCNTSYPTMWVQNFLKTIFKTGDISDTNNYRGIANGVALLKRFSLIPLDRLDKRIHTSHHVSINQIGFMKGHRAADHIFVLQTIINKIVKAEKKKLFAAFIGFKKAYDKVKSCQGEGWLS